MRLAMFGHIVVENCYGEEEKYLSERAPRSLAGSPRRRLRSLARLVTVSGRTKVMGVGAPCMYRMLTNLQTRSYKLRTGVYPELRV